MSLAGVRARVFLLLLAVVAHSAPQAQAEVVQDLDQTDEAEAAEEPKKIAAVGCAEEQTTWSESTSAGSLAANAVTYEGVQAVVQ